MKNINQQLPEITAKVEQTKKQQYIKQQIYQNQMIEEYAKQRFPVESQQQQEKLDKRRKTLEAMKQDLQKMKGSILDEFIQEGLIQAYEYEFLGDQKYSQIRFNQFLQKLQLKTKQFGVFSGHEMDEAFARDKYYNRILKIRSKIHPVFIPELSSLLKKSRRAKDVIKGKDTIVLLGSSGAGKSTTIQVLLGYKLHKGKLQNGLDTLLPSCQLREEHKQFIAKASSKSVTQYISAIQIQASKWNYDDPIYLVDTPGFFDTSGSTVETCNSLTTIEVLKKANSIRFCFIFNYKSWGKRAEAFKQFVKIVSRVFVSYKQNESRVIYILNEFNSEQIMSFCAKVRQFRRNGLNQYEKGDKKLVEVVDHILCLLQKSQSAAKRRKVTFTQTIQDNEQIIVLDPLKPNLSQIYQKILSDQRKIRSPDNQLDAIISESARMALQAEVTQLECILNQCIRNENNSAFKYYIKMLSEIAYMTQDVNDCAKAKQNLNKIVQKIKNQYDKKVELFKNNIINVMGLRLEQSRFTELKNEKIELDKFLQKYEHLSEFIVFQRKIQVNEEIEEISSKLQHKMINEVQISEDLRNTICYFASNFSPKLKEIFQKEMKNKQRQLEKNINEIIQTGDFRNFDKYLDELDQIKKISLGDMEYEIDFLAPAYQKISQMITQFKQIMGKISDDYLEQKKINQLKFSFGSFSIQSNRLKELPNKYDEIRKYSAIKLENFIMQLSTRIKKAESLKQMSEIEIRKQHIQMRNIKALCQIKDIPEHLKNEINCHYQDIRKRVELKRNKVLSLKKEMESKSVFDFFEVKDIYNQIEMLKNLNLLCEIEEKKQNHIIILVSQQSLADRLQNLGEEIEFVSYSLQNFSRNNATKQILQFYKSCLSVNWVSELFQQYQKVQDKINQSKNQIKILCWRVSNKIKIKMKGIIQDIKMEIEKNFKIFEKSEFGIQISDINESLIGKYIRIEKFFDLIKVYQFYPRELRSLIDQTRMNFRETFQKNMKTFKKIAVNQLKNMQNELQKKRVKVERKSVQIIIKLKILLDKIEKNPLFKDPEDEMSEQNLDQIMQLISMLGNQLNIQFQNSFKNQVYGKCYDLISASVYLQSLDVFLQTKQEKKEKFSNLTKKFQEILHGKQKSHDQLYKEFMQETEIDNLRIFKITYEFLQKFGEETLYHQKLKDMVEYLRTKMAKAEQNLVSETKRIWKASNWSKEIRDEEVEGIRNGIKTYFRLIKQANEIIKNKFTKFTTRPQSLSAIGSACYKIISNYVNRTQKQLKQKNFQRCQNYLMVVSIIEDLLEDNQIIDEDYNQLVQKYKMKITEYYLQNIKLWKEKTEQKYFRKEIIIEPTFCEEMTVFTAKRRDEIFRKITNQYRQRIRSYEQKYKNQLYAFIQQIQVITREAQFYYLSPEIQTEINKLIEAEIKSKKVLIEKLNQEANQKFRFDRLLDLYRQQSKLNVLEIYSQLAKKKFDQYMQEMKNKNISIENVIKIINSAFINPIKHKNMQESPKFMDIYLLFCEKGSRVIEEHVMGNRISTLKRILFFQKGMEGRENQALKKVHQTIQQIRSLLIFINANQHQLKIISFDKYFEEFKKVLNIFARQIDKSNGQSFEQLTKQHSKFCIWIYQQQTFKACVEQMKVTKTTANMYQYYCYLSKIYEKGERKQKELKQIVNAAKQKLSTFEVFHESFRILSNYQRLEKIKKIREKKNLIQNMEKLGQKGLRFFNVNFTQIIKNTMNRITKQIQRQIEIDCQSINKGFQKVQTEFGWEINVTLCYLDQIFTGFLSIDSNLKVKLLKAINSSYKELQEKIIRQLENLDNLLSRQQLKAKQDLQNSKRLREQLQDHIEQKNKIKEKLNNCTDEQTKKITQGIFDQMQILTVKILQKKKASQSELMLLPQNQIQKSEFMNQVQIYCDLITIFYKAILCLNSYQNEQEKKLSLFLFDCKKRLTSAKFVLILKNLRNMKNNYSRILINSFELLSHQPWPEEIMRTNIKSVVELALNLNQNIKQQDMIKLYEDYEGQFKIWIKKYYNNPYQETINQLVETIKIWSQNSSRYYKKQMREDQYKCYMLIAQILALWTILNCEQEQILNDFSYRPHPAQVLTIFLCLGFFKQDSPRQLSNTIAQVRSGEGKSLILAIIGAYLALSGFEVSCLCYTQYLCKRNQSKFSKLFEKLQIDNQIRYGTFDTICESVLDKESQQSSKFCHQIKKILQQPQTSSSSSFLNFLNLFSSSSKKLQTGLNSRETKKILLIDQVDTFFNRQFFGQLYRPKINIASNQIKELMKQIWRQYCKSSQITDQTIKTTNDYQKAQRKYKKIECLLNQQIKGMILGCRNSKHEYQIHDGKIVYLDQNGFPIINLNYDYATQFAYLKQHENNKIPTIEKQLVMNLVIGQFSYAILVKYFRAIIGVTGGYDEIPLWQTYYLRDEYKVKNVYTIPPIFTEKNAKRLTIQKEIIVNPQQRYNQALVQQIQLVHKTGRPVLVCFQNLKQIEKFYDCKQFKNLKNNTNILSEVYSDRQRATIINKVSMKQKITLMTKFFGRGTDFPVIDEEVIGIGGLHVIQGFVSADNSEQRQIKGRTARSGNPGSYKLVIKASQLEMLQIKNIYRISNLETEMKKARRDKHNNDINLIRLQLKRAEQRHKYCKGQYDKQNERDIIKYIDEINRYDEVRKNVCKTCIFIDGTTHMLQAFQNLYIQLSKIMISASEIISKYPNAKSSQIQLVVYRNYDCNATGVFQGSCFDSRPQNLLKFLKTIKVQKQKDHEALEIVFHHLNQQKDISQALIIGDGVSNKNFTQRNLSYEAISKGQQWLKYVGVMSANQELQKIRNRKIPISSLYLGAQEYFKKLSEQTGGQALKLDTKDYQSKSLVRFIGRLIFKGVAEQADFNKMLNQYQYQNLLIKQQRNP